MSSEAPLPRVIVVTGGGRGIGAATVRRLAVDAAAGGDPVHLVVNYANDQSSAQAVADEATGVDDVVSAAAIRADVSSESDVVKLFAVADDLGRLAAGPPRSAAPTSSSTTPPRRGRSTR